MAARALNITRKYCTYCEKIHKSPYWYPNGGEDPDNNYIYCATGARWAQRGSHKEEMNHPMWVDLSSHLHAIDATGHLICKLAYRADCRGLQSVAAQMSVNKLWLESGSIIFLGGYLLQCYFPWPMQSLWDDLKSAKPGTLSAKRLRDAWSSLEKSFANLKVVDGAFVAHSSKGLSRLKNASERRSGKTRYLALCEAVSAWRVCVAMLDGLFDREDSIEVADALEIIDDANLSTFDGQRCYKNVRLIRALCLLMNKPMKDTVASWVILRSMSSSVSEMEFIHTNVPFNFATPYDLD